MQRKWYFCSLVTKPNQACIKYSPKCIWQFLLDCNIWRVPWDFYKQPPPPTPTPQPSTPKQPFPYISLKKLFLLLPPHFFFITTLQVPSKNCTRFQLVLKSLLARYFSTSNKILFLEILFLPYFSPHWSSPKCTRSFNRSWCPSLTNHNEVQNTRNNSSTR